MPENEAKQPQIQPDACCTCCGGLADTGKTKERTKEEYKDLVHRLNRIEGQVRGIRGMVEKDAYCTDILVQVAAVNAALNSFNKVLLANHIKTPQHVQQASGCICGCFASFSGIFDLLFFNFLLLISFFYLFCFAQVSLFRLLYCLSSVPLNYNSRYISHYIPPWGIMQAFFLLLLIFKMLIHYFGLYLRYIKISKKGS